MRFDATFFDRFSPRDSAARVWLLDAATPLTTTKKVGIVNTVHRHGSSSRLQRVLVADADSDTRSLYGQALHLAGCEVIEASDGRDALAKALVRPPALVVVEMRLPLIDGHELCEILRRDTSTRGVPILVVTAESRSVQLLQMRVAGADAVLVKPTSADVVLREAQRLMMPALAPDETWRASGATAAARCDQAANLLPRSTEKPPLLVKAHARFTTQTPPLPPPLLMCPRCDRPLSYDHSDIGGVNASHSEQWDYYVCLSSCGRFQYRQRTCQLRCVS